MIGKIKMNIAVYCGSSLGKNKTYENSCKKLIKEFSQNNFNIVYGGSQSGLMGTISNEAIKLNMEVIGVITQDLADKERENKNISKIFKVENIKQRKNKMEELSDGFIALPGGFGTFDEIFEVLTLNQIGEYIKPCAFFNVNGFYDKLIEFLYNSSEEGFIEKRFVEMIIISDDEKEIVEKLQNYKGPKNKWFK